MRVVGHLVARVERPDGPDDGLRGVGEHGAIQLVRGTQRALVRHDGIAVHQRRVQQPDRVRVVLHAEGTLCLAHDIQSRFVLYKLGTDHEALVGAGATHAGALALGVQVVVLCVALERALVHPRHGRVAAHHLRFGVVAGHAERHVLAILWKLRRTRLQRNITPVLAEKRKQNNVEI